MSALDKDFGKRRNNINILFLLIHSLLPFPEKNLEDGLGIMPQSPPSTQGLTDHWGSQCCSQRDISAFVLRLWFPLVTPRQWLSTAKALMALENKEQLCSDAWPWLDDSLNGIPQICSKLQGRKGALRSNHIYFQGIFTDSFTGGCNSPLAL